MVASDSADDSDSSSPEITVVVILFVDNPRKGAGLEPRSLLIVE